MMRDIYEPPSSLARNAPYNLSLAASASCSSSSFWSDVSSQHSDDSVSTVSTAATSYSDSCDAYCFSHPSTSSSQACDSAVKLRDPWAKSQTHAPVQAAEVPAEARKNPRRTSASASSRRPPSLVRQSDRKLSFVENLVGKDYSHPSPRTCTQCRSL
jgi:hypothetical protein